MSSRIKEHEVVRAVAARNAKTGNMTRTMAAGGSRGAEIYDGGVNKVTAALVLFRLSGSFCNRGLAFLCISVG